MISSQPFNLTTNLTFFNLQPTVSGDCDFGHGGVLPGSPQGDTWWVSGLVAGDVGGSAVAHARVLWSSVWRHPAELWFNNKIKIDVFIWNPSFVLDWSPCYIFKMLESLKTYIQKYWKMGCVCVFGSVSKYWHLHRHMLVRQILHVIDKSKQVVRKLFPQIFGADAKIPEQLVVTRLKWEYITYYVLICLILTYCQEKTMLGQEGCDKFTFHLLWVCSNSTPKVCGKVRNRCGRYDTLMIANEDLDAIPEILSCTAVTMAQLLHWIVSRTDDGRIKLLDPMLAIFGNTAFFHPPKPWPHSMKGCWRKAGPGPIPYAPRNQSRSVRCLSSWLECLAEVESSLDLGDQAQIKGQ